MVAQIRGQRDGFGKRAVISETPVYCVGCAGDGACGCARRRSMAHGPDHDRRIRWS